MTITAETISQAAEDWFGIKTDPGDLEKMLLWLEEIYGLEDPAILDKVFLSGEAASFLTVSETYFFREPLHFSFFWELLPDYKDSHIRICSAAVASGCEAYSIAMIIEAYNQHAEKPLAYHIDAFDINPRVIETACQGIYSPRTMREDGSIFHYMAEPYVKRLEDRIIVDKVLGGNISFFVHNLMQKLPSDGYDLIFFRNAFIYFTPGSRERILSNLSSALKENGILIMGVSETAGARYPKLNAKNRDDVFYFQKIKNMV